MCLAAAKLAWCPRSTPDPRRLLRQISPRATVLRHRDRVFFQPVRCLFYLRPWRATMKSSEDLIGPAAPSFRNDHGNGRAKIAIGFAAVK